MKKETQDESLAVYRAKTFESYRNDVKAGSYYRGYAGALSATTLYSRLIAMREVACVRRLLDASRLQSPSCLDVPCGTGKLSKLLCERASMVIGADISAEMMSLATSYRTNGNSWLVQADAQQLPFADKQFDVVVCLRLFHRVPKQLRQVMLSEFKRVSSEVIILSMAIDGPWQRSKWWARRALRRSESAPFASDLRSFRDEIEAGGLALTHGLSVLPRLSAERIFLLESPSR